VSSGVALLLVFLVASCTGRVDAVPAVDGGEAAPPVGASPAIEPEAIADPGAACEHASELAVAGRLDEAAELLARVIRTFPDDLEARLVLARIELAADRPDAARPLLDRVAAMCAEDGIEPPADLRWLHGAARLTAHHPDVVEAGVRALRIELAEGPHRVEAALELANHFALEERLGDALGVLDAVASDHPSRADLGLARGRLLADVAAFDLAASQLRAVAVAHPDLLAAWLELGLVELARGRADAVRKCVDAIEDRADDGWLHEHAAELALLRHPGDRGAPVFSARQQLARIRSRRTSVAERSAALEALLAAGDPALARHAVRVAAMQSEPLIRGKALKLWPEDDPDRRRAYELALAEDPAPVVRSVAARRLARLEDADRRERFQSLLSALEEEADADAFAAIHGALAALCGGRAPHLPTGASERPDQRAAVVREWRTFWRSL
jgi:tetratricopeptide (TPR) repeat protein